MTQESIGSESTKTTDELCFFLFVAGLVGGLALINLSKPIEFGKGLEMIALASNLAHHGAYANPFYVLDTGLSAANPPLYPLLLTLLMKVLVKPLYVAIGATAINLVANSLTASLLPRVSLIFYHNIGPGVFASILWLTSMLLIPSWDVGLTVAGILLYCILTANTINNNNDLLSGSLSGSLAGILILLNPATLLMTFPWIGFLLWRRKRNWAKTARYISALACTLAAVLAPWVIRNDLKLGKPVLRTGFGVLLYASNNDCAMPSLSEETLNGCYQTHYPMVSKSEARMVKEVGEVQYNAIRLQDAIAWIRIHPGRFSQLTLDRLINFWLPPAIPHPIQDRAIWIITFLSIPGVILMMIRKVSSTPFVLISCFLYPLMYYVVIGYGPRYRFPMLWLSLLPAGYFLEWVFLNLNKYWCSLREDASPT